MCPLSFKLELNHRVLASRRGQQISWLCGWRLGHNFSYYFFLILAWSHFYLLNLNLASSGLQLGIHITNQYSLINTQIFRTYSRLTESLYLTFFFFFF